MKLCLEHACSVQRDDPEEDREHGAHGADRQHFPGELAVAAHALAHREDGVRKRGRVQREQDEELDAAEAEQVADRRDDRRKDDELQHGADRDELDVLPDVRQHQRRAADEDRERRGHIRNRLDRLQDAGRQRDMQPAEYEAGDGTDDERIREDVPEHLRRARLLSLRPPEVLEDEHRRDVVDRHAARDDDGRERARLVSVHANGEGQCKHQGVGPPGRLRHDASLRVPLHEQRRQQNAEQDRNEKNHDRGQRQLRVRPKIRLRIIETVEHHERKKGLEDDLVQTLIEGLIAEAQVTDQISVRHITNKRYDGIRRHEKASHIPPCIMILIAVFYSECRLLHPEYSR